MIETVILDWSGVVSDDWQATFELVNEIIEKNGLKRIGESRFRELYELPWMNFYKKIGLKIESGPERDYWEKNLPKHMGKIKLFPKAKQAIKQLKQNGLKVIVFSSHNQRLLAQEAEDFGVAGFIDSIYAGIDDKRDEIEALVRKHEIRREKTVYAGDMVHDIETAKIAGLKSIAVLSGYDSRERLEKAAPDFMIEDIGELPGLIEKLDGETQ